MMSSKIRTIKNKNSVAKAETVIIVVLLLSFLLPQIIGTSEIDKLTGSIVSPNDMNGLTFAIKENSGFETKIKSMFPDSPIIHLSNWEEMASSVVQHKADACVISDDQIDNCLNHYNQLEVYPILLFDTPEYVVLRKADCKFPATRKTVYDANKTVVTIAGQSLSDSLLYSRSKLTKANYLEYTHLSDCYYAVETGKADFAITYDDNFTMIQDSYDDLAFIRTPIGTHEYGFATQKTDKGLLLKDDYNRFINSIKETGEYYQIVDKWHHRTKSEDPINQYHFTGKNGVLKVATSGAWEPMSFYIGSKLTGLLVELVSYYCQERGYTPEFFASVFGSSITGIGTGEYDIVADSVAITEERLSSVNITDPFLSSDLYLMTKSEDADIKKSISKLSAFIDSLKAGFTKNFIKEGRWKILFHGLGVTLSLSVISGLTGTILGALICSMRIRKNCYITGFARIYVKVIQSTPVVVLLMVLYYIVFGNSKITAFWVCIIGFSLDFAAYASEIFRSGIESVPLEQRKAAKALGFSNSRTFIKVVLPQSVIHILPVFTGQFIALVKTTAVAGYISVHDLTKVSDIIRSRTFDAFFPLITTDILYSLMSALIILILKRIEISVNPKHRSRKIKGVVCAD